MCEYCDDYIIDSQEDGFNYLPLYHLRRPFISNMAGTLHLATIDMPDRGSGEYAECVAQKIDQAGGIGTWGIFTSAYDACGWARIDYCPVCGRQLNF